MLRFVTAIAVLLLPVAAQDAASQIRAEVQRVQNLLRTGPGTPPAMVQATESATGLLKGVSEAVDRGRFDLALERLGQTTSFAQGLRMAIHREPAVKGNLKAFESEWGQASSQLAAFDRDFRFTNWSRARASVRALAEAAQVRATPLMEGGRGFAMSTKPSDGLFYIGQSQGESAFAKFCASLNLSRQGQPLAVRSILGELQALQDKTNAAFQPPRSIELHERFIALNATLKLARELDAARFYTGSLFEYLDAVRHCSMLDAAPLDDSAKAALKQSIAATKQKLDSSKDDDSIAQLFLERAESQIAHPDGSEPSADEWRSARVIVEQVIPAYFETRKTSIRIQAVPERTVQMTLVRWPYT